MTRQGPGPFGPDDQLSGTTRISVGGGGVEDVTITVGRGATASGRVVFEGTTPPPPSPGTAGIPLFNPDGPGCRSSAGDDCRRLDLQGRKHQRHLRRATSGHVRPLDAQGDHVSRPEPDGTSSSPSRPVSNTPTCKWSSPTSARRWICTSAATMVSRRATTSRWPFRSTRRSGIPSSGGFAPTRRPRP